MSSKPTHIAVVTSRWGQRINPLTYGSRAWRECYGEADIADRRAALTASEDLRIEIREAPGRGDS